MSFKKSIRYCFFLSGGLVNVLLESFVMNLLHAAIYFLTKYLSIKLCVSYFHSHVWAYFIVGGMATILLVASVVDCREVCFDCW